MRAVFSWSVATLAVGLFAFQMFTAITVPMATMIQRPLFVAIVALLIVAWWPSRWRLWDFVILLAVLVPTFYVVLNHEDMAVRLIPEPFEIVLGASLIIAVLEVTRRTLGWAIPVLVAVFALYAFYGRVMPDLIAHNGISMLRIISSTYMSAGGVFGAFVGLTVAYLFLFIAFASLLAATGGGPAMMEVAQAAAGRFRGGPAKVAVVASGLFSMISGSAVANVAGTGSVTIPMMKRYGYSPRSAAAIEALASSAGNVTPPIMGAAGFLLAENLNIPYDKVIVFAALPALLFYIAILAIVDLEAARHGLSGSASADLPRLRTVLARRWPHLIPILVLIYLLAVIEASPGRSIFWCIVLTLGLFIIRRLREVSPTQVLADTWGAVVTATKGSLAVAISLAALGVLIEIINITGLGVKLSSVLIVASGDSLLTLMLLTALTSIVLGMGIPTVACYAILAVLAAPAMIRAGVHPYAAHLFVLYFGILSSITPPVALGAYVGAGIAGSDPAKTGLTAFWFAIPTLLIPFMFAYHPVLLLVGGNLLEITAAAVTAVLGVIGLSAALQGHLIGPATWFERLLMACGAVALMIAGWSTDLAGVALLVAGGTLNVRRARWVRAAESTTSLPHTTGEP